SSPAPAGGSEALAQARGASLARQWFAVPGRRRRFPNAAAAVHATGGRFLANLEGQSGLPKSRSRGAGRFRADEAATRHPQKRSTAPSHVRKALSASVVGGATVLGR